LEFVYYDQMDIVWQFGSSVVIWYIFPRFGIVCKEKSGNPSWKQENDQENEEKKVVRHGLRLRLRKKDPGSNPARV
jgi:hypothetical protein